VLLLLTIFYLPIVQSLASAALREEVTGEDGEQLCYRHAFPLANSSTPHPACDSPLGYAVDVVVALVLPLYAVGVPLLLVGLAKAGAQELTRRAHSPAATDKDKDGHHPLAPVPLRCVPLRGWGVSFPPDDWRVVVEHRAVTSLISPCMLDLT
jgi:hypothetical protein